MRPGEGPETRKKDAAGPETGGAGWFPGWVANTWACVLLANFAPGAVPWSTQSATIGHRSAPRPAASG